MFIRNFIFPFDYAILHVHQQSLRPDTLKKNPKQIRGLGSFTPKGKGLVRVNSWVLSGYFQPLITSRVLSMSSRTRSMPIFFPLFSFLEKELIYLPSHPHPLFSSFCPCAPREHTLYFLCGRESLPQGPGQPREQEPASLDFRVLRVTEETGTQHAECLSHWGSQPYYSSVNGIFLLF